MSPCQPTTRRPLDALARASRVAAAFTQHSGMEQLAAREAHNLEVAGSSPAPASMSPTYAGVSRASTPTMPGGSWACYSAIPNRAHRRRLRHQQKRSATPAPSPSTTGNCRVAGARVGPRPLRVGSHVRACGANRHSPPRPTIFRMGPRMGHRCNLAGLPGTLSRPVVAAKKRGGTFADSPARPLHPAPRGAIRVGAVLQGATCRRGVGYAAR